MNRSELEQTVNRVFDAHYVYLVRYAYRATGSFERAEDAVQAAFLSFYRALAAGEQIVNEKAWLICVARRESRRMLERDRRDCGLAGWLAQRPQCALPTPPATSFPAVLR